MGDDVPGFEACFEEERAGDQEDEVGFVCGFEDCGPAANREFVEDEECDCCGEYSDGGWDVQGGV